jgi:hypothetical protein
MSLGKFGFSHKLDWLLLAVAFLVLGPGGFLPAQAQPQAELSETKHDFGQVREDMPLVHIFAVKNTGDQNLQILDVDPDCACTVAKYDRVIPPGGSGNIILEIKPFSVIHAFKKQTVIRFNAPALPMATLVLTGQAQRGIEITPSHIVRFRGNPRDRLTAQVRLTSNMSFPWQITRMENTLPDKVEATLKTEQPGKVYVVELKNKSVDTGHYAGMVELFTDVVHRPKIYLRVLADLSSTDGPVAP